MDEPTGEICKSPASEMSNKLRILCLHGHRQNGDVLKSKLGAFRKCVGKYAEFVFITAPHQAAALEDGGISVPDQRSWWSNKDDGTFKGTNKGGPAVGFQESLRLIETAWKSKGPFQGVLGFSQGACLVSIICGLARRQLTSVKPDFAIFCSGFISGSLVHKSAYEDYITIPSLHVYGLEDKIIRKEMSQELLSRYKSAEIVEHSGGHYFPATAEQRQAYINFFQDRLQEHLENLELQSASNLGAVGEMCAENDADVD